MRSHPWLKVIPVGLATFSMFFGAGNAIFPLLLGGSVGDKNLYAMLGMLVTAIVVPFTGLISAVLYDSDYKKIFGQIGRLPGSIIAIMILMLIGPFCGMPRCVALAHATMTLTFPGLPLWAFSLVACAVIFLFTVRQTRIIDLLGYVLTPLLLISLVTVIVRGIYHHPEAPVTGHTDWSAFSVGFLQGYNTLDLLAAFFFSGVILTSLRAVRTDQVRLSRKQQFRMMTVASIIGAVLLGAVYGGLTYVAAYHTSGLDGAAPDQLLGAIGYLLLGANMGIVANCAVALACLTTAIALAAVFAEVMRKDLFHEKISFPMAVALTLMVTYAVSYLRVTGIVKLIAPLMMVCYPALIALSLLNIAHKLGGFARTKQVFYVILVVTLGLYVRTL